MPKPDISNLGNCVEDARVAALDSDTGPEDPTDFHQLRGRLEACTDKLPPLYRKAVYEPFLKTLVDELGPGGFQKILMDDPQREREAGLMLDIAQAILQRCEKYDMVATRAFQEVISDLYDGFLSAEDRQGVKKPDRQVYPALVKWGRPDFGPYTWPIDATSVFGLEVAVVCLPPANARHGLVAWSALPHECAGHDILHADTGLLHELETEVADALAAQDFPGELVRYWADRMDETASDVIGILNLGPAAGIGLIAYFRGLNAAWGAGPRLRSTGSANDPHPADILRGFLASSTTELLNFKGAKPWAACIADETRKDLASIVLGSLEITPKQAQDTAAIVAKTVAQKPLSSLEGHSLSEIQNWDDEDEEIAAQLGACLKSLGAAQPQTSSPYYAAHAVAGAVVEGLSKGANIQLLFDRMQSMLKKMNEENPSWGPLFVAHPGDIARMRTYIPSVGGGR